MTERKDSVLKKKHVILIVVLLAVLAALLAAFLLLDKKQKTGDTAEETAEPSVEKDLSDLQQEEAPVEEAPAANPASVLTGLPLDHAEAAGRRLVAVMIENTKAALPHSGINRAGVVYECPMEGGISRLMGIFDDYDGLEIMGNVRSCRPYFAYLASEYDAVYVHFGQSVQGRALLDTGIVDELNGLDGSIEKQVFFRTSDRKAPHNAYTSAAGIAAGISAKGFDAANKAADHFTFAAAENTLDSGIDCKALTAYYPNGKPYFLYDDASKTYLRYEFGGAETDGVEGQQIAVKNIIIEQVPVSSYDGYEYLNIPLNGNGAGKFLTDGKMVDITWKKDGDSEITHYYMPDGSEIALNPGRTWICLESGDAYGKNTYYATQGELTGQ